MGELPQAAARLLDLVDTVPAGRVTSYGRLAAALGGGAAPRHVGALMARYGAATCWWRVVNAAGRLPEPLARRAEEHWRAEGTPLTDDSLPRVAMAQAAWDPPEHR